MPNSNLNNIFRTIIFPNKITTMNRKALSLNRLKDIFRKSSSLCKPYLEMLPLKFNTTSNFSNRSTSLAKLSGNRGKNQGATPKSGNQSKRVYTKLWKRISLIVAMPTVAICMINALLFKTEREPPPFVKYEYLRIRNKRFPWGDGQKSLFHNPAMNPLPGGYEKKFFNGSDADSRS